MEKMPKRITRPVERLTLTKEELQLIKQAAESCKRSVQDFVIDSALAAAKERLKGLAKPLGDSIETVSQAVHVQFTEDESQHSQVDAVVVQTNLSNTQVNVTPFSQADWLSRAWGGTQNQESLD